MTGEEMEARAVAALMWLYEHDPDLLRQVIAEAAGILAAGSQWAAWAREQTAMSRARRSGGGLGGGTK